MTEKPEERICEYCKKKLITFRSALKSDWNLRKYHRICIKAKDKQTQYDLLYEDFVAEEQKAKTI